MISSSSTENEENNKNDDENDSLSRRAAVASRKLKVLSKVPTVEIKITYLFVYYTHRCAKYIRIFRFDGIRSPRLLSVWRARTLSCSCACGACRRRTTRTRNQRRRCRRTDTNKGVCPLTLSPQYEMEVTHDLAKNMSLVSIALSVVFNKF